MTDPGVNWAGNVRYSARELRRPNSLDELQHAVASADRVRVLGTRHSFSDVANTSGTLLDLSALRTDAQIDHVARTAVVTGASRYGEIAPQLAAAGFALPNLGSLPHISIAGACATGTHGSGVGNAILAGAVRAVTFVRADGELVRLERGTDPDFDGAVVSLGALGAVTEYTLDLRESFQMRQDVYLGLPHQELERHFDEILAAAYSVSLFLDFAGDRVHSVWLKQVVVGDPDSPAPEPRRTWFGADLARSEQHPVPGHPADSATPQLGAVGPWHERLPHFRLEYVPSAGVELQSEYLLPRTHAVDAIAALRGLSGSIAPLLQVAEIRTVAADDLWLSPALGRDVVALHFTWLDDWPAVSRLLPRIEAALDEWDPRPHWGKLFTMPAGRVREQYGRLPAFAELAACHDPNRKFGNRFLRTFVY